MCPNLLEISTWISLSLFLKVFIYFYREGRSREGKGERHTNAREKHWWPLHTCTPGSHTTGNQTRDLSPCGTTPNWATPVRTPLGSLTLHVQNQRTPHSSSFILSDAQNESSQSSLSLFIFSPSPVSPTFRLYLKSYHFLLSPSYHLGPRHHPVLPGSLQCSPSWSPASPLVLSHTVLRELPVQT